MYRYVCIIGYNYSVAAWHCICTPKLQEQNEEAYQYDYFESYGTRIKWSHFAWQDSMKKD